MCIPTLTKWNVLIREGLMCAKWVEIFQFKFWHRIWVISLLQFNTRRIDIIKYFFNFQYLSLDWRELLMLVFLGGIYTNGERKEGRQWWIFWCRSYFLTIMWLGKFPYIFSLAFLGSCNTWKDEIIVPYTKQIYIYLASIFICNREIVVSFIIKWV